MGQECDRTGREGEDSAFERNCRDRLSQRHSGPIVRGREGGTRCSALPTQLFLVNEVTPPVLLPARLVGLGAERLFFAVADGLDAGSIDAALRQGILHGAGAAVAQSQVVL